MSETTNERKVLQEEIKEIQKLEQAIQKRREDFVAMMEQVIDKDKIPLLEISTRTHYFLYPKEFIGEIRGHRDVPAPFEGDDGKLYDYTVYADRELDECGENYDYILFKTILQDEEIFQHFKKE